MIAQDGGRGICGQCGVEALVRRQTCVILPDGSHATSAALCERCWTDLYRDGCEQKLELVVVEPELRSESRRRKKRATRQETERAQEVGGKRHKGSGALPWLKADFSKKGLFRADGKTTEAKEFRLTRQDLDKIRSEASWDQIPVIVIDFLARGSQRTEDAWAVLPWEDFKELIMLKESK